jgi:hypothetical protein
MRKLLLIAVAAAFFYMALFSQQASGQEQGCCCEPIYHQGVIEERSACEAKGYNFTAELPAEVGESCDPICDSKFGIPIIITPPADCESPFFNPAPMSVVAKAVKGKKQIRLIYTVPCPMQAIAVNISRCTGDDCEDFSQIAQMSPTGVYTDASPELLWNTPYTYMVVITSRISGASEPGYAIGNAGDIECWYQGFDKFCISDYYYTRFQEYLSMYGYYDTPADAFAGDLQSSVELTFADKFNTGRYCNDINLLSDTGLSCPEGKKCVSGKLGLACITPTLCEGGGLFGLYSSPETCEGTESAKKYCFFDRSHSSVDRCYSCSPQMSCADYRSEGACNRDNCFAGNCSWKPVFPDIGIGVCVDSRFPNCAWCTKQGTDGLENADAYNEVFDQCTARKSIALTVPNYLCTFDKNAQESNGCDATACMDYNDTDCGSPAGGIQLNPDNSLEVGSTDPCSIKVCQLQSGIGCLKNADGNGLFDCGIKSDDRRQCELDHYPPNTTFVATSYKPNRMDWLEARMLDQVNGTADAYYMEGKPGYRLRVCVDSEETPCAEATTFAETNLSLLNFNDLYLQAGRDVLATMSDGENTLKYYGVDRSNNPEVVKEMTILACDKCQGPKVLGINVTPSKSYEGKFYTISEIPVITVAFNELSTLTTATLSIGNKVMPVNVMPLGGANYDYTFIPINTLEDGEYLLAFNAKDSNGRLMDLPGSAIIVVDTTPGDVTIIPRDGTVINETSVQISFTFNQPPVSLLGAYLDNEVWISKYATKKKIMNLTSSLVETEPNKVYDTTVDELYGGKKNIRVYAEDLAGNPVIGKSSFWINSGPLQIRMREPSWGVSATYVFDIAIDTSIAATCKYAYDLPAPVPVAAFNDFLAPFPEETEVVHKIPGFNKISFGDLKAHKLSVYCKAGTNISVETFELRVDPSPPTIKSAYADPAVIIERRTPSADIFTTYLKAQTDDDGFCRYSLENRPFILMEGLFSGFDEYPKKSHSAEINVTKDMTSYTYYVACKNTAELPSATVPVKFSVDTTIPFAITSLTPPYSNSTEFSIALQTNKRALCYIAEDPEVTPTFMGLMGHSHVYPVEVNKSGNYSWYVKCSTGAGSEVADIWIPVLVDTTPPVMLYVNDSSNLAETPDVSYFLDQLMVKFLGIDNETAVNAYYYRLQTFFANATILNWTLSTNTNGTAFYVTGLNLTDGNKYRFEVYPVNIIGLQGGAKQSDGVTIDSTKKPADCVNDIQDGNETDLDCGGPCPGCNDGGKCNADTDCLSGFCNSGLCALVGCDDVAKNGNETDVDCGGGVCLPCGMNKSCVQDADCASGSCNYGTCGDPIPCSDGLLTGTESDIDCGGSCPNKCGEGKNCQVPSDCAGALLCIDETCQGLLDSDNDGVEDAKDKCPNTPTGETVDENGCSASQRFTCGDEISDGWRIKYFGSVLCDGDGAPDADPDKDGLTNVEEYRARTDPANADTDGDGWNDKVELDKGYDPLDPASHPPSKVRILLWTLLILLLLAVLGVGGWLGYQYYMEKRLEALPPSIPAKPEAPERKYRKWPSIIEKLRRIARKEEPGVIDRDWVSLAELSERLKEGKVHVHKDVFERLEGLISGKIPKEETESILEAIQKAPKAFKLLRRISFEKLSPAEKEFVRKRLAFLKSGKLTSAELEEVLTKLRITAAYYRTHRAELERELEEWLDERRHK